MLDIKVLCDQIRETSFQIHCYLGHGHLEQVYENALTHRLPKAGLRVDQQQPIKVYDEDGTLIGDYLADLVVENILVVELKPPGIWPRIMTRRYWATSKPPERSTDC